MHKRLHPDIALKSIRRVRTPAGVEHFGQPIGSIIVADVVPDLLSSPAPRRRVQKPKPVQEDAELYMAAPSGGKRLQRVTSDVPRWKKWEHRGRFYYSGKEDDVWVTTDADDYILSEGPSEGEAIRALENDLGMPKRLKPGSLSHMHPLRDEAEKKAIEEKFGVKIPPGLGQIHVADLDTTERNVYAGIKMDGAWRVFPSKNATESAAEEKWARLARLRPQIEALDVALAESPVDDAVALSVLIMRLTGMRVSSATKQVGEHQTFGATSLEARHVTINKDSVTFNFIGKDGVSHNLNVKDPDMVRRVTALMAGKSRRDKLTPGVKSSDTIEYIRKATGSDDVKNHDLRTYLANVIAVEVLSKYLKRKKPKTKTEFNKMRREVGDAASKQLGNNRAQALSSYVNPAVFLPFAQEGWM